MKAPCKDCTERHSGCHGQCETYQAFRKYMEEQYEARIAAQKGNYCPMDKLPKKERARITQNRKGRF